MRTLAGGGRGVQTLVPDPRDAVAGICATHTGVVIEGSGRGGKPSELALSAKDLAPFEGHRARKGRLLPYRIKPTGIRAAGAR
jgi:topoisomerase-4 subunit A